MFLDLNLLLNSFAIFTAFGIFEMYKVAFILKLKLNNKIFLRIY